MYFIEGSGAGSAKRRFLRVGTSDTYTSPVVVGNLAAALANKGDDVDALMYWDAGHGANNDREVGRMDRQGGRLLQETGWPTRSDEIFSPQAPKCSPQRT